MFVKILPITSVSNLYDIMIFSDFGRSSVKLFVSIDNDYLLFRYAMPLSFPFLCCYYIFIHDIFAWGIIKCTGEFTCRARVNC